MIHDCMEVYVDDILVKSKTREAHHEALRRVLERARKYKKKMNPKKCVFGLYLPECSLALLSANGG